MRTCQQITQKVRAKAPARLIDPSIGRLAHDELPRLREGAAVIHQGRTGGVYKPLDLAHENQVIAAVIPMPSLALKAGGTLTQQRYIADSGDAAIVSSTVGLSKQLGLSVIAEGIESRAIADLLVRMGCEEGQGYFFGRPMPASDFEALFIPAREAVAG